MWVAISLQRYRLFIIDSDKSQFIKVCLKILCTFKTSVVKAEWAGQSNTFKGQGNQNYIENSPYFQDILAYICTLSSHENELLRLLLSEV